MSIRPRRVKIWYQSFVDPDQQSAYCKTLAKALNRMAGKDVRFDVHGMVPPDLELHRLTEFRCARQVIRHAVEAQRLGYDAFAIGHFQDGGLYEARSTVDIPVLGLGEVAMLYACTLGQKIGLVTIHPLFIPMHEEQIQRYGLSRRVVAVKAVRVADEVGRPVGPHLLNKVEKEGDKKERHAEGTNPRCAAVIDHHAPPTVTAPTATSGACAPVMTDSRDQVKPA